MRSRSATLVCALVGLAGCASVQYGDKTVESYLKEFVAAPGIGSLYVCREKAALVGVGVTTMISVDAEAIGAVKPNTFVHTLVAPGRHKVSMKNDGIAAMSAPSIEFEAKAGELSFLWVGVTGGGWGTYTIDTFDSTQAAMDCVRGATYTMKPK